MKHITPAALLDNRKFSILEIQGAESLNNLRDLIGKNNIIICLKKLCLNLINKKIFF